MRLKAHHKYLFSPQSEKPRPVTFLAWAGKGWCKVIDDNGKPPIFRRVPRFRLSELPAKPGQKKEQQDLF